MWYVFVYTLNTAARSRIPCDIAPIHSIYTLNTAYRSRIPCEIAPIYLYIP